MVRRLLRRSAALAAVIAVVVTATGCAMSEAAPVPLTPTPSLSTPAAVATSEHWYPSVDGETFGIDACLPQGVGPVPVMVLVHGGSFVAGSKSDLGDLCQSFASRGVAAFSIDYRLVPWGVFPSQVDDLGSAVEWLLAPERVAQFGLDASDVTIVGASAGAILAAQLAVGMGSTTAVASVDRVVLLSGGYDFLAPPEEFGPDLPPIVLGYLGCAELTDCPALAGASPAQAVTASTVPMLLIHSTNEFVPFSQAEAMAAALERNGVVHQLIAVDGADHADQILRTRPELIDEVFGFLVTAP